MMDLSQYLPGTGRGTMRSMVEGRALVSPASPVAPSTTGFAGGPPPCSGKVPR